MRVVRQLMPFSFLALTLSIFLVWNVPASAQAPTGTIEGTVVDKTDLAVTTAHVILTDRATGTHREVAVTGTGRFQFAALPIGD